MASGDQMFSSPRGLHCTVPVDETQLCSPGEARTACGLYLILRLAVCKIPLYLKGALKSNAQFDPMLRCTVNLVGYSKVSDQLAYLTGKIPTGVSELCYL